MIYRKRCIQVMTVGICSNTCHVPMTQEKSITSSSQRSERKNMRSVPGHICSTLDGAVFVHASLLGTELPSSKTTSFRTVL